MAQNKVVRVGPVALSNTLTTNILNCAVSSMSGPTGITLPQPYMIVKHIRIVNKHASTAATFSLWMSTTGDNGAGKEVVGFTTPVAVGQYFDWYGVMRMDVADFLVGGSNTATALTFEAEVEIGFA